jgi:hypothetical protein
VEACEDWPDRCCQVRCRRTSDQVRLRMLVVVEVGMRGREEELFRPFFLCVAETVEGNDKAEIALDG